MNRTTQGRFVAGVHAYRQPQPHWDKAWLEEAYLTEGRSSSDIASQVGCRDTNILFWLEKHGIERRTVSQARALKRWGASGQDNPMFGKTGPANPNYKDGSAPERQRLYASHEWRRFVQSIYRRDGFRCVRCTGLKKGARSLHAHHIKPWAGNVELRMDETNVVTLCRRCHEFVHSKANLAREYLA